MFRVGDRVTHKDYPRTKGRIVAKHGGIILVLWEDPRLPMNVGNSMDMPSRCSRHIPSCLAHV